jgi:Co/Zn/Cd efflux system component
MRRKVPTSTIDEPEGDACAAGCCGDLKFDGATPAYRRALGAVIAINLAAFAVVSAVSLLQGSASLGANALDFAGDSATYALSLWAIGRSVRTRSNAALIKGSSLVGLAVAILGFAIWRAYRGGAPQGAVITSLGTFGILANLLAASLLIPFQNGDANVRSVWLCTRNDLIQCLAVAFTGAVVWVTRSRWPDLVVGVVLAFIFLRSAWQIIAQARRELHPPAATDFQIVAVRQRQDSA